MAAASRAEAGCWCANARSAHRGAIRANRDRNFIFVPEVPILARRGDDSRNGLREGARAVRKLATTLANHMDADLVIFDPLAVKLLPPAVGGYGNTANRCGDSQAHAVSQTEALLSGLSHQLSAQCGLMRGRKRV